MIKINSLQKYFNRGKGNEIHVLNDITMELPERGMVAIFGKSGCGKTTLLNVIGGLDGFASGSITVEGQDVSRDPDDPRTPILINLQQLEWRMLFDYCVREAAR